MPLDMPDSYLIWHEADFVHYMSGGHKIGVNLKHDGTQTIVNTYPNYSR